MSFSSEQFKNALKRIRLSESERTHIRAALERHMAHYNKPIESPFMQHAHRFVLRPMQVMALALVVLVSSGAGLSYAASEALPGDPLYGFKVNVNEEIKTITMKSDALAFNEVERAAKRLEEAAQLALLGRLDHQAETAIKTQLEKHTQKATATAKKSADVETRIDVAAKLESEMSARSQVLSEIKEVKQINGELSSILATAQDTIEVATQDKADALAEVTEENPEITKERVAKKREQVIVGLAQLENFVTVPSDYIISELADIDAQLDTLDIETDNDSEIEQESIDISDITVSVEETETNEKVIVEQEITQEETEPTSTEPEEVLDSVLESVPTEEAYEVDLINDPELIETITSDIVMIRELLTKSDTQAAEELYADAFTTLQEASDRIDETLKLVELKEFYSAELEKTLVEVETISEETEAEQKIDISVQETASKQNLPEILEPVEEMPVPDLTIETLQQELEMLPVTDVNLQEKSTTPSKKSNHQAE